MIQNLLLRYSYDNDENNKPQTFIIHIIGSVINTAFTS